MTDPLIKLKQVAIRRGSPMQAIRQAIGIAIQEAAQPRSGGRRHTRTPLTKEELQHHNRVNRILGRPLLTPEPHPDWLR